MAAFHAHLKNQCIWIIFIVIKRHIRTEDSNYCAQRTLTTVSGLEGAVNTLITLIYWHLAVTMLHYSFCLFLLFSLVILNWKTMELIFIVITLTYSHIMKSKVWMQIWTVTVTLEHTPRKSGYFRSRKPKVSKNSLWIDYSWHRVQISLTFRILNFLREKESEGEMDSVDYTVWLWFCLCQKNCLMN